MTYPKPIESLIRERRSCRSFDGRSLGPNERDRIQAFLAELVRDNPIRSRFLLTSGLGGDESGKGVADETETGSGTSIRIGTYGVIGGARDFLVGVLDRRESRIELFGSQFEALLLFATGLGLGTCWLGGTFDRQALRGRLALSETEGIPVVSPVGWPRERRRLTDSLFRTLAGSDGRKTWEELFFDLPDTGVSAGLVPLTPEAAGPFAIPLEMVRLGPSASNRQPWRVVRSGDRFVFLLQRTKGYPAIPYDLQRNDVGIAMRHFEETARARGLPGTWSAPEDRDHALGQELEAVAAWSAGDGERAADSGEGAADPGR